MARSLDSSFKDDENGSAAALLLANGWITLGPLSHRLLRSARPRSSYSDAAEMLHAYKPLLERLKVEEQPKTRQLLVTVITASVDGELAHKDSMLKHKEWMLRHKESLMRLRLQTKDAEKKLLQLRFQEVQARSLQHRGLLNMRGVLGAR